jgi:hypothetical protein
MHQYAPICTNLGAVIPLTDHTSIAAGEGGVEVAGLGRRDLIIAASSSTDTLALASAAGAVASVDALVFVFMLYPARSGSSV